MIVSIERRIRTLEAVSPAPWCQRAEDNFYRAVSNAKASLSPSDRNLTLAQRLDCFTPVEHVAWSQKFDRKANVDKILKLYGQQRPSRGADSELQAWAGWVLLTSWIPGD